MKIQLLAVLSLGLIATSTALPAMAHETENETATSAISIPAEAAPAVAVIERFSQALHAGDLQQVEAALAEDALILESGGAERSRDEYLAGHAKHDAAFLKDAHVQLNRRTANVSGDLAWVGSESEIHATGKQGPMTLLSTETMVLERTAEGWQIVHIHWSSRQKKAE